MSFTSMDVDAVKLADYQAEREERDADYGDLPEGAIEWAHMGEEGYQKASGAPTIYDVQPEPEEEVEEEAEPEEEEEEEAEPEPKAKATKVTRRSK